MKKRMFIVDDEEDILISLRFWFERQGYMVSTFSHSIFLQEALRNTAPDVVLLDVNLRDEDGRKICKILKQQQVIHCPVLLISANPDNLKKFDECLADGAIEKPFDLKTLTKIIGNYVIGVKV